MGDFTGIYTEEERNKKIKAEHTRLKKSCKEFAL
jgi:hypothetical protein